MEIQHIQRPTYKQVQRYLDAVTAVFIEHTKKMPSETSILELLEWVHKKAQEHDD